MLLNLPPAPVLLMTRHEIILFIAAAEIFWPITQNLRIVGGNIAETSYKTVVQCLYGQQQEKVTSAK